MNWTTIYRNLCAKGLARTHTKGYERHHVVPRCMGGTDDADNITVLSVREHFVAHKLLSKLHPDIVGLRYAVLRMLRARKNHGLKLTSRQIAAHKTQASKATALRSAAAMLDPERLAQQKEIAKAMHTPEAKQKQKLAMEQVRANPAFETKRIAAVKKAGVLKQVAVYCVEAHTRFPSMDAAVSWLKSQSLPANKAAICRACKQGRTSAGYTWVYASKAEGAKSKTGQPSGRPVICKSTGQKFSSITAAADWVRVTTGLKAAPNNIVVCCQGKRESAFGYRWAYADA
jgi:hypothetical protein